MQIKRFVIWIGILSLVFLSKSSVNAQVHEVPPMTEMVAYLTADTTATGEQAHSVYGLQRGAVYFFLGRFENQYPLTLKAIGDETLERPRIQILVNESGASTYPLRLSNNLILEGLLVHGKDAAGGAISEFFRTRTENLRITFKDCVFDSILTSPARIDNHGAKFYAYDCVYRNGGKSAFTGRFIDGRSTFMDSVVIQNCTFYNIVHDILNKFGGWEKYVLFDHNTVFNLARTPLKIMQCPNINVTNNLFIQTGIVGCENFWKDFYNSPDYNYTDRDHWTRIELLPLIEDTLVNDLGYTQKIDFSNNNFWHDVAIDAALPDTAFPYYTLDFGFAREMVGADTLTWISEDPGFTKAPAVRGVEMMLVNLAGVENFVVNPGFDFSNPPYDFSYPSSAVSYTAAKGGFPLGDLNWFPDKKTEWEVWVTTSPVEPEVHEVPPMTEMVAYLTADTTATGEQAHSVYGLQRGAVYFFLGRFENQYPLTLKAIGDETLERPRIQILVNESGASTYPLRLSNNLILEGLLVHGKDAAGGAISEFFRTRTENLRITFKDCVFDSILTSPARIDNHGAKFYAYDCVYRNGGKSAFTGRFIDGRSTFMDSVVIQNCTFYNIVHDILNKFGGWEKYVLFDHNTVFNLARTPLKIMQCPNINVTNNLFIQTGIVGCENFWKDFYNSPDYNYTDRDHWTRIELLPLIEDTLVNDLGYTQKIDFSNNNFWHDVAIDAALPDTAFPYYTLDFGFAREMVGADTLTWISEDPGFTKAPAVRGVEMMLVNLAGVENFVVNPGFDFSNPPYDFSYPSSAVSYTAAKGGFPLGDLNWFPDKKTEWGNWIATDVKTFTDAVPVEFNLEQNYPNPFNPSTTISFSNSTAGKVSLTVYNTIGQKVRTLIDEKLAVGSHVVNWDGMSDMGMPLSGGIYFYRLKIGHQILTKKMIFVK